jgi:hypothetical protein
MERSEGSFGCVMSPTQSFTLRFHLLTLTKNTSTERGKIEKIKWKFSCVRDLESAIERRIKIVQSQRYSTKRVKKLFIMHFYYNEEKFRTHRKFFVRSFFYAVRTC